MNRTERHDAALDQLAQLLQGKALSARAIAERLGCSKPTVYTRIQTLIDRGYIVSAKRDRDGTRGPEATFFRVTGVPPPRVAA